MSIQTVGLTVGAVFGGIAAVRKALAQPPPLSMPSWWVRTQLDILPLLLEGDHVTDWNFFPNKKHEPASGVPRNFVRGEGFSKFS
jgi:hypothetical protein